MKTIFSKLILAKTIFRVPCMSMLCVAVLAGGLSNDVLARADERPAPATTVQWRRTVNGWERADLWEVGFLASEHAGSPTPEPPPSLHPLLVSAWLLAAAALLAIPSTGHSPANASRQSG